MAIPTVNTPEGTRDRLFAECRDRRAAQSAITSLFKRRGYWEVVTPEVEFYDLFMRSGNPLPQESMLKIIDRTGKILVMRPDCTTPIARVAATKLQNAQFPQRLYYNQTIFRSDDAHIGTDSEIAQCGIELIGAGGLRGDLEAITMAVDTLEATGVANFSVELGHAGFFTSLVEQLQVDADQAEEMRACIERKNFALLNDLIEPFGETPAARAMRALPFLFGGVEALDEAESLAVGQGAMEAIAYLRTIYKELCAAGRGKKISFDLGLVNRLDYYTGVVFRGYVQGAGRVVLAGGRYDHLIGFFGKDMPATGFAVYVDDLADCLPAAKLPVLETVIQYEPDTFGRALDLLDGFPGGTAELSPWGERELTLNLARAKGAKKALFVTADGVEEVAL